MVKARQLVFYCIAVIGVVQSSTFAESLADVLSRARGDALLDLDMTPSSVQQVKTSLRDPVLTRPVTVRGTSSRETEARTKFQEIIGALARLPTTAWGAIDWRRLEVTESLVSFVRKYDGTSHALTGRLVLGQLHTMMGSAVDFDAGWAILSSLGESGSSCWQACFARGTMSSITLDYCRNPGIIREQVLRDVQWLHDWRRMRNSQSIREEVSELDQIWQHSVVQPFEDERPSLEALLKSYLRLGDLKEAKQLARQLHASPHHDNKSKEKAGKWLKRIEQGGNPWKEGDWGSMSIGETHPPYPDEK